MENDGYETLLNLRPEYLREADVNTQSKETQKLDGGEILSQSTEAHIDTTMDDRHHKEIGSKQSDSIGGRDENKTIRARAMGKMPQSTTGISNHEPGNDNSQGVRQSPDSESPHITDIDTTNGTQGEEKTYGGSN